MLDANRKPVGLISGAGLFAYMADALSSTSVLALAQELESGAETAIEAGKMTLGALEYIRDVVNPALRSEQDDFLVVDEDGRYVGLSRKSSLLSPPARKIIMVDHNELEQAVPGLAEAEIDEVLDHHRLNSLPTSIRFAFILSRSEAARPWWRNAVSIWVIPSQQRLLACCCAACWRTR